MEGWRCPNLKQLMYSMNGSDLGRPAGPDISPVPALRWQGIHEQGHILEFFAHDNAASGEPELARRVEMPSF